MLLTDDEKVVLSAVAQLGRRDVTELVLVAKICEVCLPGASDDAAVFDRVDRIVGRLQHNALLRRLGDAGCVITHAALDLLEDANHNQVRASVVMGFRAD